ncbi:short-chain dehydrogenase/reductase [Coniochaeta ligniaria NRRL 30616]|uniref:Short-chain dehydrogenase/reductase n=1 Tax=Coniochaeta ligniaria NRRL 30616 TaxID=1408157 RepID=A0A1J7I757_9PEZI|nr:short-chain dehydrogenase/reductase [Coniochaeta ligniaria NRRL 30616]
MKSVLITGCSAGGIGAALAHAFHQKGYHVFATARTPSKIPSTLSSASNVTVLKLDVLSSSDIAAAVESVSHQTGGKLDVLVNNSGGNNSILPALDVDIAEAKAEFDLNFWAPLAMMRAFAPLLIEARGCLVNNTSASAVSPFPLMSIYNASKAALATASETWRHELQPLGVRTITLITTGVNTGSFRKPDRKPIRVPESSRYYAARDFIVGVGDGRMQDGAIPAERYAAAVVREVEGGGYGTVWAGTQAWMARVAFGLTPKWAFDMLIESIVPFGKAMAKATLKSD